MSPLWRHIWKSQGQAGHFHRQLGLVLTALSLSLVPYMFLSRWWIRKAGFATRADRRVYKNGWEAVIGIEVHAQINSKTKLFSGMQ